MTAAVDAKIVTLQGLRAIRQRRSGQRIVLCHGTFDLVHIGHLLHLEGARAHGDVLVATLTGDGHVGKQRAIAFDEQTRARQLAFVQIVDYVAVVPGASAVPAIEALRPDVYVKGAEYEDPSLDASGNIVRERDAVERYGGVLRFTGRTAISSTKLSHFHLASTQLDQAHPFLQNANVVFRDIADRKLPLEALKAFLRDAARMRVCVVGETIVDEWVDITDANVSRKSRCVAGIEATRMRQVGGAGIVARHLAPFVGGVECVTNAGADADAQGVARREVSPHVITKTRFCECDGGRALFESKSADIAHPVPTGLRTLDDYDVVLISDFGHGLLDAGEINRLIADSKRAFVAVMAQANSSNFGYNLLTKYRGARCYSANRAEAELCVGSRALPTADLLNRMVALFPDAVVSLTDGAGGTRVRTGAECYDLPALTTQVIDTIGCGDAYFAFSSIAAALSLPASMIALAGSIGAAGIARRRGNDAPVSPAEFLTIGKIVI